MVLGEVRKLKGKVVFNRQLNPTLVGVFTIVCV